MLDTALGRRITDISEVRFAASDVSAAQVEALREATVRARRQAEAIATAGTVGGSPTVVQPSVPVSVTVYGRWELVAKQP